MGDAPIHNFLLSFYAFLRVGILGYGGGHSHHPFIQVEAVENYKWISMGVALTCIHEIDYLCWFFGNVDQVFSFTGKFSDLEISVEDLSAILLKFKKNIIAEVHLDYFQQPDFRSCKVIGTKGTMYWDSETNEVHLYDTDKRKWIRKIKLKL